ncbi:MAG TPA: hypothetical protein VEY88_15625 [Archangium sp.]|nr:hypothetical protein [Archangium sp.]
MPPTANAIQRAVSGNRGQGMTEYIIIVVLVAMAVLGVVGIFGHRLRLLFATSADSLAAADNAGSSGYFDSLTGSTTGGGPAAGMRMGKMVEDEGGGGGPPDTGGK